MDADAEGSGTGTQSAPFSTLTAARRFIRTNNAEYGYPEGGITVKIKEGDYFAEDAFSLNSQDGGTEQAPVVWEAEGKVRIIGGMKLDMEDFTEDEDGNGFYTYSTGSKNTFAVSSMPVTGASAVYLTTSYNSTPYFPLLFNGEYKTLARYPNDGYDTIASVQNVGDIATGDGFEFTPDLGADRLARWKNEANLCVQGYWGTDYTDLGTPACVTGNGTIKANYPSGKTPLAGQRYYAYNALCEMDTDGEYYIDNSTGTVHFVNEYDLAGEVIIGTNTTSLISLNNVSNLTLKGIEFVGGRKNAVSLTASSNIRIEDCSITGVNGVGIYTENVNSLTVDGCTISDTGSGGIRLKGGDFENLVRGNNVISNNVIHDFSKVKKTYAPAVSVAGYANTVANNTIYNAEHEAITVNGNDNIITANDISAVVKEASDMGAIYVGKNKAFRGNQITNNYIHDLSTDSVLSNGTDIQAIFLDDLADGYTISGNIFANIEGRAVKLAGGRDNTITGNVFVNCGVSNTLVTAIGLVNPEKYIEQINEDRTITTGAYKKAPYNKYPHLSELDFTEEYKEGITIPVVGTVIGRHYPAWMYPMYNNISGNYTYGTATDIDFSTYNNDLLNITDDQRYNTLLSSATLNFSEFKDFAGGDYSYGNIDQGKTGAN